MLRTRTRILAAAVAAAVAIIPNGSVDANRPAPRPPAPFNGPVFGLSTGLNGRLLVADASAGIISVKNGVKRPTIPLPGVTDMSRIGNLTLWALTGAGDSPEEDTGQGVHRVIGKKTHKVANLWDFEETINPDGNDPPDSNPFDIQSLGPRAALVVDAGGNDLLRVNKFGRVDALAVFPDGLVSTDNIKELAGCPSPAPFCSLPPQMPAQSTPTSIAVGPDGYIYVGELRGFPAPTNESSIWRISPDASNAQCGSSPDCVKVFDGGFTSIIDLTFGPDGLLYVAELDEASWAAVEIFGTPTGGTINACDLATATCVERAGGIPVLTAITFGGGGDLWAVQNALTPGGVEVVNVP
jgi:hypothetical protein